MTLLRTCHVGVALTIILISGCGGEGSTGTGVGQSVGGLTDDTMRGLSRTAAHVPARTSASQRVARGASYSHRIVGPIYAYGPRQGEPDTTGFTVFFRTDHALPKPKCFPCEALYVQGSPGELYTVRSKDPTKHCYNAVFEVDSPKQRLQRVKVGDRVRMFVKRGNGKGRPATQLTPARTATARAVGTAANKYNRDEIAKWKRSAGCS